MSQKPQPKAAAPVKKAESASPVNFPFDRINYILLIAGVVIIMLGFILMIGGGSDDPNVFNEAMFDFRRITLAPILILLGFGVELAAILKKPKN